MEGCYERHSSVLRGTGDGLWRVVRDGRTERVAA